MFPHTPQISCCSLFPLLWVPFVVPLRISYCHIILMYVNHHNYVLESHTSSVLSSTLVIYMFIESVISAERSYVRWLWITACVFGMSASSKTQEQDKPHFCNTKRLYQMTEDATRTWNLSEDERQPWADISSARGFILLFTALRTARNAFFLLPINCPVCLW